MVRSLFLCSISAFASCRITSVTPAHSHLRALETKGKIPSNQYKPPIKEALPKTALILDPPYEQD